MTTNRQFVVIALILTLIVAGMLYFLFGTSLGEPNERAAAAMMTIFTLGFLAYVISDKVKSLSASRG